MDPISAWLDETNLINRFCTQNGWVDGDSVRYEVQERRGGGARINVYFTEIVMEGSGCVAGRIDCFGQLDIEQDAAGRVMSARVV